VSENGIARRLSIGNIRSIERADAYRLKNPNVSLPNPTAIPPLDRMRSQPYEAKVQSLGLGPNYPQHFWQLLRGDAGAGSSAYRRTTLFQQLAAPGIRAASTPYSKSIELATQKSSDQRPRYWQVSLLGIGRIIETPVPIDPLSDDEILDTASGISQSAFIPAPFDVVRGIPLISTTKFRIMVHDESGQRFVDVDCIGTRSFSVYGFGVTVFALIKDEGYEVDRQVEPQQPLAGMLDQSIVGARVIPIRTNFTQNPNNNTVTANQPADVDVMIVPIPPGSKTVQVFNLTSNARFGEFFMNFQNIDPLAPGISGSPGAMGEISPEPGKANSAIYQIPDANSIVIIRSVFPASDTLWSFVFEETP